MMSYPCRWGAVIFQGRLGFRAKTTEFTLPFTFFLSVLSLSQTYDRATSNVPFPPYILHLPDCTTQKNGKKIMESFGGSRRDVYVPTVVLLGGNGLPFSALLRSFKGDEVGSQDEYNTSTVMYERLLNFASHALMEHDLKHEDLPIWKEPFDKARAWKPCADQQNPLKTSTARTGFIMVSANGGLNQQRVAVCNSVAVTYLLNATLVLPRFLYSTVWKDGSQFGDIYQEEYFINSLREDSDY